MKNILKTWILLIILPVHFAIGQTVNGDYARTLQKKYPTQPTNFCTACKLWINPYYKSIADTAEHRPLITFYIYTKAHRLLQEQANIPRSGTFATWNPAYGQKSETTAYENANQIVNRSDLPEEIQKGHCQAWILLAYNVDGAILSDTYTFNSAMECRGQNLGTEIASEERCRKLTGYDGNPTVADSIKIWCGTYGNQRIFNSGMLKHVVPTHYYKILDYYDKVQQQWVEECYWMPNQPDQVQIKLESCKCNYAFLCVQLGFKPKDILQ